MRRIPDALLLQMGGAVAADDRDEMAIPSYLHANPAMRWMAWRRVEVLARSFHRTCVARGGTVGAVLDFGCGSGVLLGEASQRAARVYGVDLVLDPARMLVDAWDLGRVELVEASAAAERIPDASIDVVLAAEVLEHVEPVEDALALFRRKLAPGGSLLVSLPTESGLYRLGRRLAGFHGHYHHADAASIDRAIEAYGFRRERLEKVPFGGPLAIYWVASYRWAGA